MNLRLGESRVFQGRSKKKILAAAFRTFSVGDEVKLTDKNGSQVWFKVSEVTDDDDLILARCPVTETQTPISSLGSITISADFKDPKTGFRLRPKEIVTVTDAKGKSTKLQVDVIVGREFVVLGLPGKNAISFFNKLRLLWHIGKS